eukprot:CAMPEP_0117860294 /NCGR_PEP_ID=MMETSP0950-20121206/3679_1 /TAXON_ID=44440 /ORGANISM="Chattonella subsalsa, Strain CCMP2191" /LENGTH=420 /DNA_ID=CAMNT_0005710403 /DNA_START=50 /DNA_END=1309 /DNA_ORIENTATION=-
MGNILPCHDPCGLNDLEEYTLSEMYYWYNFQKSDSHTKDFKIISLIGSGKCGNVYCAERKIDQKLYALKVMRVGIYEKVVDQYVQIEASIMYTLNNHPNIIKFHDHYYENIAPGRSVHVIVMELASGGQLFDRITQRKQYSEREAKDIMYTLLGAINYCHQRGIIHRDLKPENILLVNDGKKESIKIADFGYATRATGQPLTEVVGTPLYLAPEIASKNPQYSFAVDMWSLGVICFILIGGYPPFYGRTNRLLFAKVRKGKPRWRPELWNHVSDEAKDLIKGLLNVNPRKRLTAKQALSHPWIRTSNQALEQKQLFLNLDAFKKWNAKRKLRVRVEDLREKNDSKEENAPQSTKHIKHSTIPNSPHITTRPDSEKRGRRAKSDRSIFEERPERSSSSTVGPDRRSSVWTQSVPIDEGSDW